VATILLLLLLLLLMYPCLLGRKNEGSGNKKLCDRLHAESTLQATIEMR
jgi:hypothetical protein